MLHHRRLGHRRLGRWSLGRWSTPKALTAAAVLSLGLASLSTGTASADPVPAPSHQARAAEGHRLQQADQASRERRAAARRLSIRLADEWSPRLTRVHRARALAQIERQERRRARAARRHQAFLDRWVLPIHAFGWSAGFGDSGPRWSTGYHTGQDLTAPAGTPVYAVARGTIAFAGWNDAYGNKLEITHYDGSQSWYAHLIAYERTSGTVRAGELIGYVGCTGNCYGTHLHLEMHLADGEAIDPVPWLREHGVGL